MREAEACAWAEGCVRVCVCALGGEAERAEAAVVICVRELHAAP